MPLYIRDDDVARLAREVGELQLALADEAEKSDELRFKVSGLETALVRMSCAEEDCVELRARVQELEALLPAASSSRAGVRRCITSLMPDTAPAPPRNCPARAG